MTYCSHGYRWVLEDTKRKRVVVFADDDCYGYNGVCQFVDDCRKWCKENKLDYYLSSWKTMDFIQEDDMIIFLLRWG